MQHVGQQQPTLRRQVLQRQKTRLHLHLRRL
jgi:hypothetical protein